MKASRVVTFSNQQQPNPSSSSSSSSSSALPSYDDDQSDAGSLALSDDGSEVTYSSSRKSGFNVSNQMQQLSSKISSLGVGVGVGGIAFTGNSSYNNSYNDSNSNSNSNSNSRNMKHTTSEELLSLLDKATRSVLPSMGSAPAGQVPVSTQRLNPHQQQHQHYQQYQEQHQQYYTTSTSSKLASPSVILPDIKVNNNSIISSNSNSNSKMNNSYISSSSSVVSTGGESNQSRMSELSRMSKLKLNSEYSSKEAYKDAERSYLAGHDANKSTPMDQVLIKIGHAMSHSKDYTLKTKQFVFARNSAPYFLTRIEVRQFIADNLGIMLANDEMNLIVERFCLNNWNMDLGNILAQSRHAADKQDARLNNVIQEQKKKRDNDLLQQKREDVKQKLTDIKDENRYLENIMIQLSKSAYCCLNNERDYQILKGVAALISGHEFKRLFDHFHIDVNTREFKILQSKYFIDINLIDFETFRTDFIQLGKDMKKHLAKLKTEERYKQKLKDDDQQEAAAALEKEQEFRRARGIVGDAEKSKALEAFLNAKKASNVDKSIKRVKTIKIEDRVKYVDPAAESENSKAMTRTSSVPTIFEDDDYDHFNPVLGL